MPIAFILLFHLKGFNLSVRMPKIQLSNPLKPNAFLLATTFAMTVFFHSATQALTFHPRMDESEWLSDSHILQCQLTQPIPLFGRAVFDHSAGQPLRFYLQSVSSAMAQGQALLQSEAPVWNPTLSAVSLASVKVTNSTTPINLDAMLADQLLNELYQGKSPNFIRRANNAEALAGLNQHSAGADVDEAVVRVAKDIRQQLAISDSASDAELQTIKVGLSSVHFREAYAEYRQCLEQLMPVGFDQLSRSRVHFGADKWQLSAESMDWLNTIVRYVQADSQITQLYIDGYTDNLSGSSYNAQLSKKRAEAVTAYLISQGIPAEQLTTRFHGERFPVASNKTIEGRSTNRRVTIRLDRLGDSITQR